MARVTEIRKTVTDSTPVFALVGATDLAVERVRHAVANASALQAGVEARMAKVQEEVDKTFSKVQVEVDKTVARVQEVGDKTVARVQEVGDKTVSSIDPAAAAAAVQTRVAKALEPKNLQQVPALAVAAALEAASQVETSYEGLAVRGKELVERLRSQQSTQDLIAQGKTTLGKSKAAVTTARKAVDGTTAAARNAVTIGRREGRAAVAEVEKSVADTEKVVEARAEGTKTAASRAAASAQSGGAATRSAVKGAATSARKTAKKVADVVEESAGKIGD